MHLNQDFCNADFVEVKLKDRLYSKCTKHSNCHLQAEKREYCTGPREINTSNKTLDKSAKIQRAAALETKLK